MQIERDEAVALLKRGNRGIPVLATGGGAPPREVRNVKELPAEPAEGYDGPPLEFHRLRDDHGNWTRAGMEHAIRSGGSVMHQGNVITRVEDLPDEAELAAGDEPRLRSEAARIDGEIAKLAAQRSHLQRQGEEAAERARAAASTAASTAKQQQKTRAKARQGEQLKDDMAQGGESKMDTTGAGDKKE